MKKIVLLFIILPLLSFNASITQKNIVGKWKVVDGKNISGLMIFEKSGFVTIEVDGKNFGGKVFELNGAKASMKYSTNWGLEPFQIDFILTFLASNDEIKMLSIAKFQDKDTLILASKFTSDRPTEFTADNSAILHRIE